MTSIMPVNLEQNQSPSSPVPAARQDGDLAVSSNDKKAGRQRKPAQQEDEVTPTSVFAKLFGRRGTQKQQTKVKKTKSTPDKVSGVKVLS
jgi:hypothetical protein